MCTNGAICIHQDCRLNELIERLINCKDLIFRLFEMRKLASIAAISSQVEEKLHNGAHYKNHRKIEEIIERQRKSCVSYIKDTSFNTVIKSDQTQVLVCHDGNDALQAKYFALQIFYFFSVYICVYLCEVWMIVFNATINNISVISWQSVLLVEETRVPGENHRPAINIQIYLCLKFTVSICIPVNKRSRDRSGHQEWTIQRNGQHCVLKPQDEDKQNKNTTQ